MCVTANLLALRHVDSVHRADADVVGGVIEEQHAGQELGVMVVSVHHDDGDSGAGVEALRRAHLLGSVGLVEAGGVLAGEDMNGWV